MRHAVPCLYSLVAIISSWVVGALHGNTHRAAIQLVSHWCFSRVYYILTTILKRSLYTIYYYILLFSCSLNCFTIFYHFFNVPLFRSRHAVSIYDLHLASLRLHTRKLLGRESDDGRLTRFGHVHYRNHLL